MSEDVFTVRLEDADGRVGLSQVRTDTEAHATAAAVDALGVSGPTDTFQAGQVIDQNAVRAVSGTDADGDPVYETPNVALSEDPSTPLPVRPPDPRMH